MATPSASASVPYAAVARGHSIIAEVYAAPGNAGEIATSILKRLAAGAAHSFAYEDGHTFHFSGDAQGGGVVFLCAERGLVDVAARILVHPRFDWDANVADRPTPALTRLLQRVRDEVRPEQLVAVLARATDADAGGLDATAIDTGSAGASPGSGLRAVSGPRSPPTPPSAGQLEQREVERRARPSRPRFGARFDRCATRGRRVAVVAARGGEGGRPTVPTPPCRR